MHEPDDIRTVTAAYAAFAHADLEKFFGLLSENVVWDATNALWQKGVFSGHDGVRDYFSRLDQMWDGLRLEDYDIDFVGPGRVCVRGRLRGRARPTGGLVDSPFTHWVETTPDGKIARLEIVVDEDRRP